MKIKIFNFGNHKHYNGANSSSVSTSVKVQQYGANAPTIETEMLISDTGTVNNLDYNRIAASADNVLSGNFVKINISSFEGVTYKIRDDGTVALYKDGTIIGFTDLAGIGLGDAKGVESVDVTATTTETPSAPIQNAVNGTNVNVESAPQETSAPAPTVDTTQATVTNGSAKPEDFSFRHDESNILAAKARNMGFTDDQIKIAVGVSRWETGNYQHLASGYNYGGVTGSGDLGNDGQYAVYSSADAGMDAYLNNLKTNYFDQGLNSVDDMARKYLGYDDIGEWVKGVNGCMK